MDKEWDIKRDINKEEERGKERERQLNMKKEKDGNKMNDVGKPNDANDDNKLDSVKNIKRGIGLDNLDKSPLTSPVGKTSTTPKTVHQLKGMTPRHGSVVYRNVNVEKDDRNVNVNVEKNDSNGEGEKDDNKLTTQ